MIFMSKKLTIEELTNIPMIDLGDSYLRTVKEEDNIDVYDG